MNKTKYDNNESAVFYKPISLGGVDLIVTETGYENCDPSHAWGPDKKSGHCIHYVLSGKGRIICKGKETLVTKNQVFYASPDFPVYYEADKDEPWEYIWITFNGTIAKNVIRSTVITADNPVVNDENETLKTFFENVFSAFSKNENYILYSTGYLYLILDFFSKHYPSDQSANSYLQSIIGRSLALISQNFLGNLSVETLARKSGLCRSQLYRIFMSEFGYSPKEYITRMKIVYAAELIKGGAISINKGASEVGYNNYNSFSKSFKRIIGVLPTEFVELNKNNKFVVCGTYLEFLKIIHSEEEIKQF